MTHIDTHAVPLDPTTHAALAERGLDYRSFRSSDGAFAEYHQAVGRGFMGVEATQEQLEAARSVLAFRRLVGIYDDTAFERDRPIATVSGWSAALTVEPGCVTPMWAISSVTVSPTHRRRGIARALVEGELRAARDAGIAIAGLTVSEATIYAAFGFGPAVYTTTWKLDTRRTRWIGPRPAGRLDAVPREQLAADLAELHERIRLREPGQIGGWDGLWRRTAGVQVGQDGGNKVRGVRYTDAAGTVRGVVSFTLEGDDEDYAAHTLHVGQLIADGPDAYAALWRFVLEHDLVRTVTASLLSTDEPVRWMIADQRGITVTDDGHEWFRILDVPGALSARTYHRAGSVVLGVDDPLGFAAGSWRLTVDADGSARVERVDLAPDLELPVATLGSILLGGVRATTLAAAGRLAGPAEHVRWLEDAFRSPVPPRLSLWY